jgi:3-isopropylmalate dehydrogenase
VRTLDFLPGDAPDERWKAAGFAAGTLARELLLGATHGAEQQAPAAEAAAPVEAERVGAEVGKEYPDIAQEHAYIDAACMWMVKNPEWFDVAVTTNLFGDIITDVGAMIQGGLGIAASGNIHPGQVSLFEPIHGSAPKYAGKDVANPVAAVMAVAMMLEHLGEGEAARCVEGAVAEQLTGGAIRSLSAGVQGTREIGELLAAAVAG